MSTAPDEASSPDRPAAGIRTMNSVLSTLRVFEEVAVRQPVGVSDLARATRIPKSSVQRCLVTLQQAGWLRVVDAEPVRWGVTMKVLALGLQGAGEQDLRVVAAPVVARLAAHTGETVFLGLRDGDEYIIVGREESRHMVRVHLDLGARLPLRATSGGVAMMARLDRAEVDELLAEELTEFADAPVQTNEELRQELTATATRGYAVNMSAWYRPHVASFGAAIVDRVGRPVGAVALSIPEMRYDSARQEELGRLTVAAADEISALISSA
ncbi:IclR family transcriptional regulator [Pseudonocardia sulfidoxydans NBRC 16205]|uniref:IclR family transcriptional regulator n=1 Tax=Pseudonocardia sulfidoxydans NBRC 16205 TaxID=1223511 RepID=A0A511DRP1_9PSEU|nr:IclR family transcriptional regulator [Pseudonocardia sulfidoxydans]GEL26883.1 IclR family transcriptional regulator [Pseudonocardia sulfidoxydans NBRC 16205]